jgi:hypothetical protein
VPDYTRLRDMVGHRLSFDYDTGARVIGYLATCRPATGPVQLVVLSRAEIHEAGGPMLERRDELILVPNLLVGLAVDEGPTGPR